VEQSEKIGSHFPLCWSCKISLSSYSNLGHFARSNTKLAGSDKALAHTHTAAITAVIFQLVHIIAGAAAHDKSSIARTRTALGRRPCPALPRPTQPTTGRRPLQMLGVFTSVGGPSSRPNVLKMQIRAPFSRYPRARPAPLFGFVRPPG
jgi:hypothetical protein